MMEARQSQGAATTRQADRRRQRAALAIECHPQHAPWVRPGVGPSGSPVHKLAAGGSRHRPARFTIKTKV